MMEEAQKIKAESTSLPVEILMDIIARLPVSSLLQIKLVCRAWRHLLQHPHLPLLHFSRLTTHPSLILQSRNSTTKEMYFLDLSTLNNDDDHDNDSQPELKKLSVPATIPEFIVLGSCRGIMCLTNALRRSKIYLYNPLVAEMKEIVRPNYCGRIHILGFGYHPATKEYKVVTIASAIDRPSFRFRIFPGSVISVLTLAPAKATKSSESTSWRRIGGLVPYHFENQTHQVPVMGRLHWAARRRDNRSWKHLLIMSFDLSDETIKEVSMLPVQFDRNFYYRFELMVIGSCLGVAEYKVGGEIKIWVMKEYGLESSWVNEITIHTTSLGNPDGMRRSSSCTYFHMMSDFRVLWVLRNGDVLLEFKRRGLVLYDPMNGILKNVWIREGRFLVDEFKFTAIVHEGSFCDIDACINI